MSKIPKIVHYCWMSEDPWDEKTIQCFNSWKDKLIGWEFKLWNFKTLPTEVLNTPIVSHAIAKKRWAFVADYVRIWALYNYGGIYMDLDVELLKNPESYLNSDLIFGLEKENLGAHFIGSIPSHEFLKFLLKHLVNKTSFLQLPAFITPLYEEFYGQLPSIGFYKDVCIYPEDYFNPFYWDEKNEKGRLNKTENTICIHWYAGAWIPRYKKTGLYKSIVNFLKIIKLMPLARKLRGY